MPAPLTHQEVSIVSACERGGPFLPLPPSLGPTLTHSHYTLSPAPSAAWKAEGGSVREGDAPILRH